MERTCLPTLAILGAPRVCRRALQLAFPEYRIVLIPRAIPVGLSCRLLNVWVEKLRGKADDTRIALWCEDGSPLARYTGRGHRYLRYLLTYRCLATEKISCIPFRRSEWTRRMALSAAAFKLVSFPGNNDGCMSGSEKKSLEHSGAASALWELVRRMTKAGYLPHNTLPDPEIGDFRRHWLDDVRYAAAPGAPEEGFLAGVLLWMALTGWCRESRRKLWIKLKREVELALGCTMASARKDLGESDMSPVLHTARRPPKQNNYALADTIDFSLWEQGRNRLKAVRILAETAMRHFDFAEATRLARLGAMLSKGRLRISFCMIWGRSALLARRSEEALAAFCFAFLRFGREVEFPYPGYEQLLSKQLGNFPWQRAITAAAMLGRRLDDLPLARSLMLAERFVEADAVMARRKFRWKGRRRQALLRAELALYLGRNDEARIRLAQELNRYPSPATMDTAARLCLNEGDMTLGKRLLAEIERRGWSLDPLTEYHLLLGLGLIHKAFVRHGQAKYFHVLDPYPAVRMLDRLPVPTGGGKLLVLSECFPGDEVRFSRLYSRIAARSGAVENIFACDPRLRTLLSRSFPDLTFVAVDKQHNIACTTDPSLWRELPEMDCCRYLDNRGWKLAANVDYCITVMQTLPWVIEDYESLNGLPLLRPDPVRRTEFMHQLAPYRDKLLVGLGWRSSLTRYDRNLWSTRLATLEPLFRSDHVQFVCCQYDGCTEEEELFLNRLPPGSLLRPDIDQTNDIDGAAALYSCLDMVVTAPMFTSELAGALGIPMVIFSPVANASVFRVPESTRHAFFEKSIIVAGMKGQEALISFIEDRMTWICNQFLPEEKHVLCDKWRKYRKGA